MAPALPTPARIGVFSYQEIIGDGLYKIIFLRGLRHAFPAAEITWMTTRDTVFSGALAPVVGPFLDHVVPECGIGTAPSGLLRRAPALGPFDLLLDTQALLWRTLSAWRVPHGRFLSAALLRRGLRGTQIGPHALDRLFALLETARGEAVPRDLAPLVLPPALTDAAAAALPEAAPPGIAIAPGAGGAVKRWPIERFVALAQLQAARGRQPVFLLGPQEAAWRERIAAEVPGALFPEEHPAMRASPIRGPLGVVAIAARCAAGVANDAGPGHMIAASGTPLLSLFGPTSPAKFRPVALRSAVVRAQEFGGTAMADIPVEPVASALDALLAG
jgi:ADP-heptose:LPS heptosyltransferase